MILNVDLYEDLSYEVVSLLVRDSEFLTRFILSGKQTVIGTRKMMNRVSNVELNYEPIDPMEILPPVFCYVMKFGEESVATATAISGLPCPVSIIRWGLSSTKALIFNSEVKFPKEVLTWFLDNPNLKRLTFKQHNLYTAKQLLKSRKFDFVSLDYNLFKRLKDVLIDTEEIEVDQVSLKKILGCKFIKTKSLICKDFFDQFNNNLKVNVNPNFRKLEKLEIKLRHVDEDMPFDYLMNSSMILNLFKSVNAKLDNLDLLTFSYNEYFPGETLEDYNLRADDFNLLTSYENGLVSYDGKPKVKLNHTIYCEMVPTFDQTVNDYIEELKKDLQGFEYSSWVEYSVAMEEDDTTYCFKKSRNITNSLQTNIEIQLMKDLY